MHYANIRNVVNRRTDYLIVVACIAWVVWSEQKSKLGIA
jgi:hypothetical protein